MTNKNWLIAAALASAAVGGVAIAAQDDPAMPAAHGHGAHAGMLMADTNHDGRIDRAEYQAWIDQRFARLDANHDGHISPDERHHGAAATDDGAGRTVDQAAYRRGAMARFDRMDTNHDGVIDAQEQAAMRDMMRFRMAGQDGAGAGGPMAGAPGMGHGHGHGGGMMAADANGDGRVSRDEFLAQARTRFDAMDANHDGYVDASERPTHARRGAGGHGLGNMSGDPADLPPPPATPSGQ